MRFARSVGEDGFAWMMFGLLFRASSCLHADAKVGLTVSIHSKRNST
jgi:hypothetical protein